MRAVCRWVAVAGALTALSGLVGCGDDTENSGGGAGSDSSEEVEQAQHPDFGECGRVTDDEVRASFGMGTLPIVTRNSVGCVWESGFGPSVSFSWYRGSPIDREKQGSNLLGRPPDEFKIEGHPAFKGTIPGQLCEVGVQFTSDFFHWSVTYETAQPSADPCKVAVHLAQLAAERTK